LLRSGEFGGLRPRRAEFDLYSSVALIAEEIVEA